MFWKLVKKAAQATMEGVSLDINNKVKERESSSTTSFESQRVVP